MSATAQPGNPHPKEVDKQNRRAPRRIVLLAGDEHSAVARVLAEFTGNEERERGVHQQIQKLAQQQRGRWVAVEWLNPLGWTRFLWCWR